MKSVVVLVKVIIWFKKNNFLTQLNPVKSLSVSEVQYVIAFNQKFTPKKTLKISQDFKTLFQASLFVICSLQVVCV